MERNKKIWIYNAGSSFSGNPKWMFLYMKEKHPEIKGIWLTYDHTTTYHIRKLGYKAYLFDSATGKKYMKQAGVYVVNQVKEIIQPELYGITMLNLWHGVGCKTVEQKVDFGFLRERIIKKYICNNKFYQESQLFLVTSPLMEEHFIKQCGLSDKQLVRAGYPCCQKMDWVKSFDHDIRKKQGMGSDAKIVMYCPTYRDGNQLDFFGTAIPDMEQLIAVLKANNILLIMKLHPQMIKDSQYVAAKNKYSDCPNVLFWDNLYDIYEIFDQIDTAIIDYSSIFYDLLAAGVPNYIRYMFDIDDKDNLRDFVFDVKEMTCGTMCESFDALLNELSKVGSAKQEDQEKKAHIKDLFWSYDIDSCEKIFNACMEHNALCVEDKVLHSYDIFDTVIKRKCLSPVGVFAYVSQKLNSSEVEFPAFIKAKYRYVRMGCESNAREYVKKSLHVRSDKRTEITFDMIFDRMKELYALNNEQIDLLKKWELECELETVVANNDIVEEIKALVDKNEKVVFISDMYLPKEFIAKLINKVAPELSNIPLFVSSDIGSQKTTRGLYLDVFKLLDTYDFTEWVHNGDNANADQKQPELLGIKTRLIDKINWEVYEQKYLTANFTYDAYCCAAVMRRLKYEAKNDVELATLDKHYWDITYNNVAAWLVPYVAWAVEDAYKKNVNTLYFISRDGYLLKLIADEVIRKKNIDIKTKYIYGSRKAWRIPSYIESVDDDFFEAHGHIADITDYNSLLEALRLDNNSFLEMLPELSYVSKLKYIKESDLKQVREILKSSVTYRKHILEIAKKERPIVLDYLKQEIDFNEKFVFVEYWGRGYTQECLGRLLREIKPDTDNAFYYIRSIYFSDDKNIRYNMSNDTGSLVMTEAIFANTPYKTIVNYERTSNGIVPIIKDNEYCNKELQQALEIGLVKFVDKLYDICFVDEDACLHALSQFGISHYRSNKRADVYVNVLAKLVDSVAINGEPREFAPPLKLKDFYMKLRYNEYMRTRNIDISIARSSKFYKKLYRLYRKKKKK